MTTTEIAQIIARMDSLERHISDRLERIEADLADVMTREQRAAMRAEVRAEILERYGIPDDPTDPGRPLPVPSRVPSGPMAPVQPPDQLDGLVATVRENFRFTVVSALVAIGMVFGGGPQLVEALALLGWIPRPPVPVQIEAQVQPAPLSSPSPFAADEVGP